jgi:hypothetical protein
MSDDLVNRLTIKAGVMEMGEKIAWGSDTALMREAADRIEELQASRDMWAQVSISWAERAERAEANLNIAMISLRAIADMDEGNVTAYIQKVDAIALDALDQIALKP